MGLSCTNSWQGEDEDAYDALQRAWQLPFYLVQIPVRSEDATVTLDWQLHSGRISRTDETESQGYASPVSEKQST